jgi:hypothetical protein
MRSLLACVAGAALLLPSVSVAAETDTPPSVAAPAAQSNAPKMPQAPSKLSVRFTTQWSTGSSTSQTAAEPAPRVAPRIGN